LSLLAELVRRRVAGDDPVRLGLVASLARPGGNATGINFFTQEITAKRLGLLHDLVPKAVSIAALLNPANAYTAEATQRDITEAARAIGLQIQYLHASTSREIEQPWCANGPTPSSCHRFVPPTTQAIASCGLRV
jgi:putative ABC transport system substrate-binding protein